MRAVLLVAAAAAAENGSAWRERLGLAGSACPVITATATLAIARLLLVLGALVGMISGKDP